MTSRIAIIPARGGSKRIPRKNIRAFHGKPVIAYPIKAALESGLFDEVMVSTDDEEIARIARELGAKVPFMRSKEASSDTAGTLEVLREVCDKYKSLGKSFEEFCCIYPVSPLLDRQNLIKASELIKDSKINFVVPVCRYSTPVQRSLRIENNRLTMADPTQFGVRSQDLEPRFFDVGQFYFGKTQILNSAKSFFTENTCPLEIDDFDSQDVDNESDWKILEFKYAFKHGLLR